MFCLLGMCCWFCFTFIIVQSSNIAFMQINFLWLYTTHVRCVCYIHENCAVSLYTTPVLRLNTQNLSMDWMDTSQHCYILYSILYTYLSFVYRYSHNNILHFLYMGWVKAPRVCAPHHLRSYVFLLNGKVVFSFFFFAREYIYLCWGA